MLRRLALLAMLCSTFTLAVHAEDVFALTSTGNLIRFSSDTPGTVFSTVTITGLQAGDSLVGIDFRPATGQLYGLGKNSRVYVINVATGAATAIGTANFANPALSGNKFAFDFNPQADRIRIVSTDTQQNIRVNPNDGANAGGAGPANGDFNVAYAQFDVNAGKTPALAGVAYSGNFPSTGSTTLYGIDATQGTLVTQGSLNGTVSPNGQGAPTNAAQLFTIGNLGVSVGTDLGFDISGATGIAYAAMVQTGSSASKLFQINLNTGSATEVGAIGSALTVVDISVVPPPFPFDMVGLAGTGLLRFMSSNPAVTSQSNSGGNPVSITGLAAGESIIGIDFRPADGKLYGLANNGGNGRIYTIDPVTGVATAVSSTAPAIVLTGTNFGFDFNPAADRIRIVSDQDQNLRVNPNDGLLVLADGTLDFVAGDPNDTLGTDPNCVASAYINNSAGVTSTTLYNLDSGTDQLYIQNPPNSGGLVTVGNLGVNIGNNSGFDITSNGNFVCANANLYRINLSTGALTQVGTTAIGPGTVVDIAAVIAPSPSIVQFSAATYSVVEGSLATITINRTGTGACSVFITTSGNVASTATLGTDFDPFSQTVSFADGETSKTVLISALTDTPLELFETVQLVLTNPIAAAVGTQGTAVLTIIDFDDRDGDGFTTAEELAAGTSDNDASSTPFGGAPAGSADTTNLTIAKTQIKLSFTKTAGDSISLGGTLAGFTVTDISTLANQKVVLNVGGVIKSITLGAKGKGASSDKKDSFTISKPKNNVSKISISLKKGDFDTTLTDEGLGDDADSPTKAARTIALRLLFNGKRYEETIPLSTTIKAGKGSTSTQPKLR